MQLTLSSFAPLAQEKVAASALCFCLCPLPFPLLFFPFFSRTLCRALPTWRAVAVAVDHPPSLCDEKWLTRTRHHRTCRAPHPRIHGFRRYRADKLVLFACVYCLPISSLFPPRHRPRLQRHPRRACTSCALSLAHTSILPSPCGYPSRISRNARSSRIASRPYSSLSRHA